MKILPNRLVGLGAVVALTATNGCMVWNYQKDYPPLEISLEQDTLVVKHRSETIKDPTWPVIILGAAEDIFLVAASSAAFYMGIYLLIERDPASNIGSFARAVSLPAAITIPLAGVLEIALDYSQLSGAVSNARRDLAGSNVSIYTNGILFRDPVAIGTFMQQGSESVAVARARLSKEGVLEDAQNFNGVTVYALVHEGEGLLSRKILFQSENQIRVKKQD